MTTTTNTERVSILAIDDDSADARILQRNLKDIPGWDVDFRAHRDSIAAMADLVENPPDVLFLDYRMGAQDGLEVLQSIRGTGIAVPVIFLTGQGNEELVVRALRAGASDYLTKNTLSPESLRRSITNAREKYALQCAVNEHRENLEASNRELVRRNEEIRRFYQTLSHELKTPLTAAREFASLILDGLAGDVTEQQGEHLQIVVDSCDQMMVHVNDLLDVTRLETGKLKLTTAACDLAPVIEKTVASLQPAAQSGGIGVEMDLEQDLPEVHMDARRITQVLANLIRNAIKFTPEGGRITVRARLQGSKAVHVLVEDTGSGIAPEDVTMVFERLYQSGEDEADRRGGIGLGLHLCRELVHLHGGEIWIERRTKGGTRVTFSLPRHLPLRSVGQQREREKTVS